MSQETGGSADALTFVNPLVRSEAEPQQKVGQKIDDLITYIEGVGVDSQKVINDFLTIVPDRNIDETDLIAGDSRWKEVFSFRLFKPNGGVNIEDIHVTLKDIRKSTNDDYERVMVRDKRVRDDTFEYQRLRVIYQRPTPERQAYNKKMGL